MKPTIRSTNILSGRMPGRMIYILFCLTLLLLTTSAGPGHETQPECQQKGITSSDADVMDQAPAFSTGRGWTYGNKIGTIPKGTQILICEKRTVGFFSSKQLWYRVNWASKNINGWVNGSSVEERGERQSILFQGIESYLFPTAFAEDNRNDSKQTDQLQPPPLFLGSCIAMIFGMVAKALFDQFTERRAWISTKAFIVSLIPSLMISPIVFLTVIKTADFYVSETIGLIVLYLFAFQNGFFWKDVLSIRQTAEMNSPTQNAVRHSHLPARSG